MIPRTLFSSDHELFRDSVRKFLEQEAVPFHAQWEKDGHHLHNHIMVCAAAADGDP